METTDNERPMDGDSSTTDASQLGITGEYMASSHYVLQSQDGEEPTEGCWSENSHKLKSC
ncbi:hypothetical protein INR49_002114 [Caranx melampygus]|nr:hypothetical protein INR49_002114 [Caranx melampygus]